MKLPAFASNKRFELDLPGATANATFTAGQPLTLMQVGLGNHTTTVSLDGARRARYLAHPGGNMAGVEARKRLHRLPRSCSK
jgi:hypothetical protein